jgi:carbon-monoxide dehydrogenase large subunit
MKEPGAPHRGAVGASIPRLEGRQKVTGRARYTDDYRPPGMLHAAVLGSPYAHARIRRFDLGVARAVPGVRAVITGEDFPEHRLGLFIKDQPAIARGKVRFVGEPVAAVAADDAATARRAARAIGVEYEELPAVMEPADALLEGAPLLHEDYAQYRKQVEPAVERNVIARMAFNEGDVDAAWASCDVIVEGEYVVPAQHHLYLEPCTALAEIDAGGRITIHSSTQWVFGVQSAVAAALGVPHSRVRAIAPMIGGGFGAKYEFTVEPIAARLAQLTARPVRLTLSREEDMGMVKSRHRGVIRMKTGARGDGRLLAREIDLTLDGGAYSDESPAVLGFALIRAPGPYRIAHLRSAGRAVYTNRLRAGAYRGFGNPQVSFAGEVQIDELAWRLGIDPIDFRIRNAKRTGDPWLGGTTVEVGSLASCLERVRDASRWADRRRVNRQAAAGRRRGVGVAAVWHICGLMSAGAEVRLIEDGGVRLCTGAVDLGEGADTVLVQICAGVLGLDVEQIHYVRADTDVSPYNFSTSGSRTTYMVGRSVEQAAVQLRAQILHAAGEMLECAAQDLELRAGGRVGVRGAPGAEVAFGDVAARALFEADGEIAGHHRWLYRPHDLDPKRAAAQGYGVGTNIFGAQAVEVDVDELTGKVDVLEAWSAHDVGRAINPASVEGQIQGGFVQGMGYALCEEMLWADGALVNPSLMDYKIPGAQDTPHRIHPLILEHGDPRGPFGAKGIGEPPLIGVAPAIANAIYDATGARLREVPFTPERVLRALLER